MSSISSVSNLNVVILMKVHLPVHLSTHTVALWICGEKDRRCFFLFCMEMFSRAEETVQ